MATNWQSTAYYPASRLLVAPLSQSCMDTAGRPMVMQPDGGGTGASRLWKPMPGKVGLFGKLAAYDVPTLEAARYRG